MEMQNVKNQVTNIFTPARLKKAVAFAVLVGVVTAGGAYYHHRQAEARSVAEKQARSEMVAAQAEQSGLILIDEDHVRMLAAEAVGKSTSDLDFRSIYLTAKDHDDRDDKRDKKHRDGKHDNKRDGKHDDKGHRDGRPAQDRDGHPGMMPPAPAPNADAANAAPAPMADGNTNVPVAPPAPGAPAPASNAAPTNGIQPTPNGGQRDFHPVYKVKCYAGNIEYKVSVDAVTGTVLSSKVDVDDDLF